MKLLMSFQEPAVGGGQSQRGFSEAVSIGLCLLDTWIDSRVIGNIHHSLLGAPECRESAFVVGAVMGQV